MGLKIMEEDFYEWYSEVMRTRSPCIVRQVDESKAKKRVAVKGKGKAAVRASSDEEEDGEAGVSTGGEAAGGEESRAGPSVLPDAGAAKEIQGRGRGRGGAVSKGAGLLVVRIPAPSQVPASSKMDNVGHVLQAKVQRLEHDLQKELDKTEDLHRLADEVQRLEGALRMENLVESKERYKGMVRGLKDMQAAARDRIRILEAAVGEAEVDQRDSQRKLEEALARVGVESEERDPAVEEYLRNKEEYAEWRDTGVRRMELAQELARAEEDRGWLQQQLLAQYNERQEHEEWRKVQEVNLEDMEEELRAVVEKGEAAQVRVKELVEKSSGKKVVFPCLQ